MRRHRRFFVLIISTVAVIIFAGVGCDKDNPVSNKVNPPGSEPDYHLIMDMYTPDDVFHDDIYYLITASTRADTLVDSMAMPPGFHKLVFSNDGSKACFSGGILERRTWLVSWPSFDTLGIVEGAHTNLAFSSDDKYLLAGIKLYNVPDLSPIYTMDSLHMNSAFIPNRSMFCYNVWPNDSIYFVDYGQTPPVEFALPAKEPSGKPMAVAAFCPSKSGDSLILATQNGEDGIYQRYIVVVSTDDLSVYDLVPYEGAFFQYSTAVLHTNGRKVYLHYEGSPWDYAKPLSVNWLNGTVYEYDIPSREMSILVNESDVGRFHPMQLLVTPNGEYLYIMDFQPNKVFKVRLSDNQITEPLSSLAGNSMTMAIYPISVEE